MANQYTNKVVINGVTKIDLTGDTITAADIAYGKTAHDKSGAPITGTSTKNADTSDTSASADEVLAVYRPIVAEHSGTRDDPIPFISGMDVHSGRYYSYGGTVYLAKADMIPCVWAPDSGIWQWEKQ